MDISISVFVMTFFLVSTYCRQGYLVSQRLGVVALMERISIEVQNFSKRNNL